jgi:hypothetical protein
MKLIYGFIWVFILFGISFAGSLIYTNQLEENDLEKELYNHLLSVAESKSIRVNDFLNERKDDLVFLSSSKFVVDAFERENVNIDKLNFFKEKNEYLDLILINMQGKILFSFKDELVGRELNTSQYNESKLMEVFKKVKMDFGVGIFDPGYSEGEDKLSIFITSPVFVNSLTVEDKKEMIGIIAIQVDNFEVEKRIQEDVGFGEIGEIYLVNRDGTLISSLKNQDIKEIQTDMKKDCFIEYNNFYLESSGQEPLYFKKYGEYKNYFGENVFGTHQYVLQTGWCVLVEVNQNKFYNLFNNKKINESWIFLSLFLFLFVLFSFIFYKFGVEYGE